MKFFVFSALLGLSLLSSCNNCCYDCPDRDSCVAEGCSDGCCGRGGCRR